MVPHEIVISPLASFLWPQICWGVCMMKGEVRPQPVYLVNIKDSGYQVSLCKILRHPKELPSSSHHHVKPSCFQPIFKDQWVQMCSDSTPFPPFLRILTPLVTLLFSISLCPTLLPIFLLLKDSSHQHSNMSSSWSNYENPLDSKALSRSLVLFFCYQQFLHRNSTLSHTNYLSGSSNLFFF